MKFSEQLKMINACEEAIEWVKENNYTLQQAWNNCERGDWMLWFAAKQGANLRKLVLAKAHCANLARDYMTDQRSRATLDTAIAFGRGEATKDELDADAAAIAAVGAAAYAAEASGTATAAYADAAAYATDGTAAGGANAAGAAAYAAEASGTAIAAWANAAGYAAGATGANAAVGAVAYAAGAYTTAAEAAYAAGATGANAAVGAVEEEILKKCSDICRKILSDEII